MQTTCSFSIDEELFKALDLEAISLKKSKSDVVREALKAYFFAHSTHRNSVKFGKFNADIEIADDFDEAPVEFMKAFQWSPISLTPTLFCGF